MKFECQKADILPHIHQAQNIVGQRTTLQILSNLLIEARDGKLSFSSTDLDLGMRSLAEVDIIEEGSTTVPARKLFDIIKNLPEETISVQVDSNQVMKIECGKSFYRIFGLAATDFPKLPDFSDATKWTLKQTTLKAIIRHTQFAISRDESRYVLNGIHFMFKPKEVLGVATDGRRLSLSHHTGLSFDGEEVGFIIPAKTVAELMKLLGDSDEVHIYHKGNQVCFSMNNTMLITKLIEGNFPEYDAVIPKNSPEKVVFNIKSFTAALQRVSVLTSEKSNSVKLQIDPGKCIISANSPNVGDAREEIEVKFDGKPLQIAFNPMYLLDILKCLEKDTVTIELTDGLKPGLVRDESEFLSVIMPMRLTD